MSCGVVCRHGSDPALLWLWRRSVATALIRPLAWELPYAAGAAQENVKKDKKKKKKKKRILKTELDAPEAARKHDPQILCPFLHSFTWSSLNVR